MSLLLRVVLVIVVALLPALGIQLYNENALRAATERDMRAEAQHEARSVAGELELLLSGIRGMLVALAAHPAIRAGDPAACMAALADVRERALPDGTLALVDAAGRVLCGSPQASPEAASGTFVPVPSAAGRGGFSVGGHVLDPFTGRSLLGVVYPVHGLAGVPDAMLMAGLDLRRLRTQIEGRELPAPYSVMLADRAGHILLPLPEGGKEDDLVTAGFGWMMTATAPGVTEWRGGDGVRRIIGYVPPVAPMPDLFVSVGYDTDAAYAEGAAASRRTYLLMALGFGLACILAFLVARRIIGEPVGDILRAVEQWREGTRGIHVRVPGGGGEIARIARAVNELVDAAGHSEAALARANAELERRVAERTQQLEAEMRERQRAQADLLQSQKMEVLGYLTGGIAHDFNNLLTAVIGNLQLAMRRSAGQAELQRLLLGASRAADRGAALIRRMLAFARRQVLHPQAVDLQALVGGMENLLARTIGPAVRVAGLLPPGLWHVRSDPAQLELVLLNLAINARDAMPEGGTLIISAGNETVLPGATHPAELAAGEYVRISVVDTGVGMDVATLARACEPFFTTKPVGRGSGLGLSMVHGVAMQSGGGVQIESQPGEGTTVSLWLPRAEALPVDLSAGSAEAPPAAVGGATILLVDDDEDVVEFAACTLDEAGYRVLQAGNGAVALALLQAGTAVDLLVTDLAMPKMTGSVLVRHARALRPGLPVLVVTGYADLDKATGDMAGLPVLDKPYRAVQLLEAVARLLATVPAGR
ncbi:Histidine kinase [Rhodovastum atsumiense]|uniref:histidine kinase n=1 Tax=Rhodovastum atsumiense TaxID=504468 RepID=A0A5M6IPH4_9PROT|nr:ATP-binding protein [Rhodovastum atsumiense]KAA5609375.1 response regulator [Rhodovastum atsumiense]CAH2598589.1 Histidine kinase [Rhodovastum atsumiense]